MKHIILLFLSFYTTTSYGQTNHKEAYNIGIKAIQKMEAGNTEEAISLLEEAKKLDPRNINYPYEIAYAYYLDKNYKAATKVLNSLTNHKDVNDRIWQMLGNCYDMDGKPDKAIQSYEKGLELFPKSGILYLERGNMELQKEAYNDALNYYESGIDVQPDFPSNYYWAAKIYMSSTEEVWGMIYGEIFMNLETNTNRTRDISKQIYDTYKSQITYTSDSSMTVSFCQQMTMTLDDLTKGKKMTLPFCMIYEPTLLLAVAFNETIDINSLAKTRANFTESYYEMGHNKTHPNILFDFQKEIAEEGHAEAYHHWILMQGDLDAFTIWEANNKATWDDFIDWFSANSLNISATSKFHSGQY